MIKPGKRTGDVKGAPDPAWTRDTANQSMWNGQFIGILKRDYVNSDVAISAILRDEQLSQLCATKIRSYVGKNVSAWLYEQRKARGAKLKRQLEIAVAGLRAAIGLCMDGGKKELLLPLGLLADEFSQQLGRCKQAFATKRHGRDRDHAILYECHSFLQEKLGQPVTYVTLANLVNAGYEADGGPLKEPVDEEQIRKNLANFKRNNPLWHLYGSMRKTPT
ncbi:MAG: hypothetical protein ABSA70_14365 [Terriglobia bacterium]